MSGMEPTVDSVVSQPLPVYWYYVLAGVGALLLLVVVTVTVILCCHRYHWAPKKSSHHNQNHSVTYHSNQLQGNYTSYQNQNMHYNLIHQNHMYPATQPNSDPTLTIRLEKDDFDTQCWSSDFSISCVALDYIIYAKKTQQHLLLLMKWVHVLALNPTVSVNAEMMKGLHMLRLTTCDTAKKKYQRGILDVTEQTLCT